MKMTPSPKRAKSRTRDRKPPLTKAGAGRAGTTRADLERQLQAGRRELAHARERLAEVKMQQAATSEMLRLISNSPGDMQSVLDAVARHAAQLCKASNARIWRLENDLVRLVATYGESAATMDGRDGLPADRTTVTGRAACDRRTIHVHDISTEDIEFPLGSSVVKGQGWHTTLATPLLCEGAPIGVILVRRREIRPFHDQQIALLETFASHAAIAIENMRLFEAEKQTTLALSRANRDLAESEARIRRLVDSNIIGIFIWDFDGRILEANDRFLGMVSYDREDLLAGRIRWADLTPPDWRDRNNARIDREKGSGRFEPFEKEFSRKDGTRVPVVIGGATFDDGGNQGVAFVLDLTERKRAEEALRESEAKFSDYASTASDWLWKIGPDYRFTLLTESAFNGDGPNRIGTFCWEHALDLETEPEKWRLIRESLDSRKPFRDFVYCSADGSGVPMYVKASGKPVFEANGEFSGYRGTCTDVTAIMRAQRAEASLRTAEAEARESKQRYRMAQMELAHANRVATMGQLTASIAHEVNQPIASSIANAQAGLRWLDRQTPELSEVRQALAHIVKDGHRAASVVDQLRALFKKSAPNMEQLDINAVVAEAIELARSELVQNGVSARTQLPDDLPAVQGDRTQLQQVMLNLIVNAVQAMAGGGDCRRDLMIGTSINGSGEVRVSISDSGPGIASEDLDRLFDPFFTTKSDGMGMGLSICRAIVRVHGGQLWAEANVSRGAAFHFTLPAASK